MGKREFYAWVDQVYRDSFGSEPNPHNWSGDDNDDWWQKAREKRDKLLGRR